MVNFLKIILILLVGITFLKAPLMSGIDRVYLECYREMKNLCGIREGNKPTLGDCKRAVITYWVLNDDNIEGNFVLPDDYCRILAKTDTTMTNSIEVCKNRLRKFGTEKPAIFKHIVNRASLFDPEYRDCKFANKYIKYVDFTTTEPDLIGPHEFCRQKLQNYSSGSGEGSSRNPNSNSL